MFGLSKQVTQRGSMKRANSQSRELKDSDEFSGNHSTFPQPPHTFREAFPHPKIKQASLLQAIKQHYYCSPTTPENESGMEEKDQEASCPVYCIIQPTRGNA